MHSFKVKIGNILYQKQHLNQLYLSKIKFRKRHLHHSRRFPLCPFTKPPLHQVKRVSQVALVVKNPPANARDISETGLISGSERSPEGGHGNPVQCSCLENPHGQRSLMGYSP